MKTKQKPAGWGFWIKWELANAVGMFLGYFAGFFTVILTSVFLEFSFAPSIFGIMLGLMVGAAQALILRPYVGRVLCWIPASAIAAGSIVGLMFSGGFDMPESIGWLVVASIVAGAIAGALQWLILRNGNTHAAWWIPSSAVGWGSTIPIMMAVVKLAEPIRSDVVRMGLLVGSAVLMWALPGSVLAWILRQRPPNKEINHAAL